MADDRAESGAGGGGAESGAGGAPDAHRGLIEFAYEELGGDGDNQPLKMAWIVALVFHFALFVIVFPEMGTTMQMEEKEEATVIKRYKPPEPPKQQPKKKVVKRRTAKVPIPDPTPDEPEPIVSEEEDVVFVEDEFDPTSTDIVVGAPSGPPVQDKGPMRVGGEVEAPQKIKDVNPQYPDLARRARLEGVVILEATIDTEGNVVDLSVLRGLGLGLDQAAIDAVSQWKYRPTYYNGRPVPVLMTVTVQFQLQ